MPKVSRLQFREKHLPLNVEDYKTYLSNSLAQVPDELKELETQRITDALMQRNFRLSEEERLRRLNFKNHYPCRFLNPHQFTPTLPASITQHEIGTHELGKSTKKMHRLMSQSAISDRIQKEKEKEVGTKAEEKESEIEESQEEENIDPIEILEEKAKNNTLSLRTLSNGFRQKVLNQSQVTHLKKLNATAYENKINSTAY